MKMAKTGIILCSALLALTVFSVPSVAGPMNRVMRVRARHRIIRQLGLTPDQKAQIRTIRQNDRPPIQAIRKDASLTPRQKQAALKPLRQARRSQVMSVLTPDQRTKLQELRNARFARWQQRRQR